MKLPNSNCKLQNGAVFSTLGGTSLDIRHSLKSGFISIDTSLESFNYLSSYKFYYDLLFLSSCLAAESYNSELLLLLRIFIIIRGDADFLNGLQDTRFIGGTLPKIPQPLVVLFDN